MKLKRKPRTNSTVIQEHHLRYASLDGTVAEWKVKIWKGEHWIAHLLLRRKRISKGFIIFIKDWLEKHEKYAEELK